MDVSTFPSSFLLLLFLILPLSLLPLPPFYSLSLMLKEFVSCGTDRHMWVTLCCPAVGLFLGISSTSLYLSTAGYVTLFLTHFHGFPLFLLEYSFCLGLSTHCFLLSAWWRFCLIVSLAVCLLQQTASDLKGGTESYASATVPGNMVLSIPMMTGD